MKKNNTKVELKKYLSQKEKIKNTFISSCIILVILTFFIFITYSYFIEDSGEIDVGNTYAAIPEYDVEIINNEIVENTNNRQTIITIRNNSSTNTYSYNLNYDNLGDEYCGGEIYYKIPSEEYSHPEGIIKPFEVKKILLLVGSNSCVFDTRDIRVNSGYEYVPFLLEEGRGKINYSPYSSNSRLINLEPSAGTLDPRFYSSTTDYTLYDDGTIENKVTYKATFSDGGFIVKATNSVPSSGEIVVHTIKAYATDGTYIQTYNITTAKMTGTIKTIWLSDGDSFSGATIAASGNLIEGENKYNYVGTKESCQDINDLDIYSGGKAFLKWQYLDRELGMVDKNPNIYYSVLVSGTGAGSGTTFIFDNSIILSTFVAGQKYTIKVYKDRSYLKTYNFIFCR